MLRYTSRGRLLVTDQFTARLLRIHPRDKDAQLMQVRALIGPAR